MAVVIETTLGDITVDLYLEQRPVTCLNFLKLCKMKYYNFNLFHTIRSGFIAQTGDPSGEGSGGESIFGLLEGPEKRFFSGEKMPKIRHTNTGLLSMVCSDDMMVGSQFFFTLGTDLDSLDGIHCVIGEVTEGHEVLRKLNEVICDETHRPYQDVRITHTVILEDPYNDPPGFRAPSRSPSPSAERLKGGRIAPDEEIDETQGKSAAEIQEIIEEKEAKARATILEIVGDLPDADIAPPENVLFVCKLNPVTTDEDLEIIFSRFGKIVSCEVIRDKKTGDSLQYAFIEFSDKKSCEDAYFKMDNVLIDDRRIHVDFSQSVSKMRWLGKGRGVQHFDDDEAETNHIKQKSKRNDIDNHVRDRNNVRYQDKDKYKQNKYDEERRKQEKDYDRRKKVESESRQNSRRDRSRSRSNDRSRKRENSRDRAHRDRNERNYRNDNGSNKFDKEENLKRSKSDVSEGRQRDSHSNSHKSKSPVRNRNYNHNRDVKSDKSSRKNCDEAMDKINKKNQKEKQSSDSRNDSKHEIKKRHNEESDSHSKSKKLKTNNQESTEPRTPSPVINKNKIQKNKSKQTEKGKRRVREEKNKKKKRKDSTSSDSESSESSSSSDTSSSSEEDRKKRSRRRKHSSSSSSDTSDSSSSSSSSSDSSSDSTSSSSGSEKNKKRKKNDKKIVKKSKRKS